MSQIFLVEKKDGGQRPVVNLKCLNQFMRVEHFKMEGLHLLPDLIQPGDWMIKLDLKDAYLQVPIHPDHQKFLVFEWNDLFYQFKCLPFGLSTAPRVFTKLLRPIVGFLRQVGCRLIIYLDDILLLHQDREQLFNISQLVNQLFQCLGLLINEEKSLQTSCLQMEYLGFLLCSQSLLISVPAEKMRKIQQDATKILSQDQVTVRELVRFVGKAVATVRALPLAPLHHRALQFQMNAILTAPYQGAGLPGHEKYNMRVLLDEASRADLRWWKLLDRRRSGSPIRPAKPTVMIESDASTKGWGAVLNTQTRTGVVWSVQEASNHINYLELLAAFLALKAFGKSLTDLTVLLRMDNFTAVTYVNPKRGHLLPELMPASHFHLEVVPGQEHHTGCRAPPWTSQYSSGYRIKISEGPLRLDVEPNGVSEDHDPVRPRPVCLQVNQTTSLFLQLEARPRSGGHGCLPARLDKATGICQSTLVPYTPLSIKDQGRDGENSHSCPSVEDTVVVSSAVGTTRGLSKSPPPSGGSSSDAIRPGILA